MDIANTIEKKMVNGFAVVKKLMHMVVKRVLKILVMILKEGVSDMQVTGTGQKVNYITFVHNGNKLKFRNLIVRKDLIPGETEKMIDTEIVFSDLYEVDMMINMLEEFKKHCRYGFGSWCRKSGDSL